MDARRGLCVASNHQQLLLGPRIHESKLHTPRMQTVEMAYLFAGIATDLNMSANDSRDFDGQTLFITRHVYITTESTNDSAHSTRTQLAGKMSSHEMHTALVARQAIENLLVFLVAWINGCINEEHTVADAFAL